MAKSGKKSKGVIPKRIAGVKVPKAVRKGRFGELLASRTGQAVIAQAILGAGAVAAGMKAKDPKVRGAAHRAKEKVADAGQDATRETAQAGTTLAYALGEAAKTFAEALRRGESGSFTSTGADADRPQEPRDRGAAWAAPDAPGATTV